MIRKFSHLIVILGLTAVLAHAQRAANMPTEADMYCSGVITTQAVPDTTYVVSGVESDEHIIYSQRSLVFINKGARQGMKVGDQFLAIRPETDPKAKSPWIANQVSLTKAMGTMYTDLGRLRVASVQENTSTAEITHACSYIQRGDLLQPFAERPAPQYKAKMNFDPFAPPSGKAKAIIAGTFGYGVSAGTGTIVYVNLGASQGVQVGSYFRVFRYQGDHKNKVYDLPKTAYLDYGFGSTPKAYTGAELPRDVLGEGIVVRVGPNAATVLLTQSVREILIGDIVELE